MLLIIAISMYTTKVYLKYLGVDDFGLYNLISGFIMLVGFFQSSLTTGAERFIAISTKNNDKSKSIIFNQVFFSILLIVFVVLILSETVGVVIVKSAILGTVLNAQGAFFVYQCSIASFLLTLIRIPYMGLITAHEKMAVVMFISIGEAILKLIFVFVIEPFSDNRLAYFSAGLLFISFTVTTSYILVCHSIYPQTITYFFPKLKRIFLFLRFGFLSMFSGFANAVVRQNINALLIKYGSLHHISAVTIGTQIGASLASFSYNFLAVANPRIIKTYGDDNLNSLRSFIFRVSKLSYFLIYILSIPFIINISVVLELWLGNVPEYTGLYTILILAYQFVDVSQAPFSTIISADGNIRRYELILSFMLILNIPVGLILMQYGFQPYWIFIVRIIINILSSIYRFAFIKNELKFNVSGYVKEVLFPLILISFVSISTSFAVNIHVENNLLGFVINVFFSTAISIIFFLLFAVDTTDRILIRVSVKNFLSTKRFTFTNKFRNI